MTISSETRKAGPFAGNDVATSFPFTFKVFSTSDVLVVQADALDAESTLVLGSDYTVTLNSDQNVSPGGTVELSAALPTGEKLVLSSQIAPLQPVDLTNSGGFYPDVINKALDRSTILIQQLSERVDRTIKVSITSGLTPDEFVEELQHGASDASASAAAAAASAAEAALFDPDLFVLKTEDADFVRSMALGTVSQSAGVPTGALIEAGSNANGRYTRFADGTQICRHSLASSSSAGTTWTYPAAFAAGETPKVMLNQTGVIVFGVLDSAPTNTAAVFSFRGVDNNRYVAAGYLLAVGRWF